MQRQTSFRLVMLIALCAVPATTRGEDSYLRYIRTAPEFQRVPQSRQLLSGRWRTWNYLPWRYRWTIGTGDVGGRFCREYGLGGFTDHGAGPFEWLNTWRLPFYNDHTAGKGDLYLHRAGGRQLFLPFQRDARSIRSGSKGSRPIDAAALKRLKQTVARNVANVKQRSPFCIAYALDDEISWGSFVKPIPWRLNGDDAAYARWLRRYYGTAETPHPRFVTPDFTQTQLQRSLQELDFSPLLDRMTYNDSVWANFLGELVRTANQVDPDTPCGFVGGQAPNLWGGYDYAKLMKKVQFIEAYNLGSSQAIIRSFNPGNALPQVTTHFHSDERGTANDIWQTWYYFAHGNRGMIGWVDGWFDGKTPRTWLKQYKATNLEVSKVQSPKLAGASWMHDGVAIYYSHPSIQVSWCLDIEPHGKTWVNRGNDHRLGTSHNVRKAWEYLLTDSGIQYDFIAYDEVIVNGVPEEYKVLILPACYALSDIEAERIESFCRRGGTVIADFAPGIFDQHGKGRRSGALDALLGVRHDGTARQSDFFGERLWVETDQDVAYSYQRCGDLFRTITCRLEDGFAIAYRKQTTHTTRQVGSGRAVLINLSPQRYLQYREEETATPQQRKVFMRHVEDAGVRPWVAATGPDGTRPAHLEITYWRRGDRVFLFILQNAPITGSEVGGGGVEGLRRGTIPLTVRFRHRVRDVVDERRDKRLGDGKRFDIGWNRVEAALISFRDPAGTPADRP